MQNQDGQAPNHPRSLVSAILTILLLTALTAIPTMAQNANTGPVDGEASDRVGIKPASSSRAGSLPGTRTGSVSAYEITSTGVLLSGQEADGQLHDYMLENDRIAVVISDIGHTVHYALSGGNIIDAGSSIDRLDSIRELYSYFDDNWPRQAIYSSLQIMDNGSTGGPAVIRAIGVDSDDPSLEVVTDYSLEAGADHVAITSTLTNTGTSAFVDFEVGDALTWGTCREFSPWYGFDLNGQTTTGPWLAGISDTIAYGYAGLYGDIWGPHGSIWSDMNATMATIGPGDSFSYSRVFVVGEKEIASVATLIHEILNTPVGLVECSVVDSLTAIPVPGAAIHAYNDVGDIYLLMETDNAGESRTTLPPGTWQLVASAWNYLPENAWIVVVDGGSVSHDFLLSPVGSGNFFPEIPTAHRTPGDTLTVIQRPLVNIPAIVREGDILDISCDAAPGATGWTAMLRRSEIDVPLDVLTATYDPSTLWWELSCLVPPVPLHDLYDLRVTADGEIADITRNAVKVIPDFKEDYYFIHITDTHLPTHMYYTEPGSENDRSEIIDLREVMADIDLINPEFVLLTGDFVNEGELEDFLNWRVFTRGQAILSRFPVPVYLTAGNHDIGGWDDTPPPDGTARRDWWRFFGWNRLDDPPPGAPWYTQNYSFDYGPVHFVGMEAYDNYDEWRQNIYGNRSFTAGQIQWLNDDLAAASGSLSQVLFYHYDFKHELDLNALGVEMALWGHVHSDQGSIHTQPYDLATNRVCDGKRRYRMIRVSNGVLQPQESLSAGSSGESLIADFTPANNGMHDDVTCVLINDNDQRFEHGLVKFVMPKGYGSAQVTGGTLLQVDESGDVAVYYVSVDILSLATVTVNLHLVP